MCALIPVAAGTAATLQILRSSRECIGKAGLTVGACLALQARMALIRSQLAYDAIGAAIEVHRHNGPGLYESVYDPCYARALTKRRLSFERQVEIPVVYDGIRVGPAFRADYIIEGELLVELKAVGQIHPLHESQVLTYLKLSGLPQALLINFNVQVLRHGVKSFLNSSPHPRFR